MVRAILSTPFIHLVLIVEKLLSKLRNDRVAQGVGNDRIRNVEIRFLRSLLQNAINTVKLCLGLARVGAGFCKRYTELVEFDVACQLAIGTAGSRRDHNVVGRFEILHGLVGIARLLAELSYSLL